MSTIQQLNKAKSQTSLLTTMPSVPTDSNLGSSFIDNQRSQALPVSNKSMSHYKGGAKTLINQSKSGKLGSTSANIEKDLQPKSNKVSHHPPLFKSASSSDLLAFQTLDEDNFLSETMQLDTVDVPGISGTTTTVDGKNPAIKWNATLVDIETTEIMLHSLDEHIKNKRDKISKDMSQKAERVGQLISNLNSPPDKKYSKKIRRDYETTNKSAEKSLEKTKIELEQLEYKRFIVDHDGIPWGKDPSEYVKNINKKDRNKKVEDSPVKEGSNAFTRFLKGHIQKSASAENVCQLVDSKSSDTSQIKTWYPKSESVKKSNDNAHKYLTLNESTKSSFKTEQNSLSKSTNHFQSNQKPHSVAGSSVPSWDIAHSFGKGNQFKNSKSNSISSGAGPEFIHENLEHHGSSRKNSLSLTSADDIMKSDDVSFSRFTSLQEEMNNMKRELNDVRNECHRLQFETDNLRRDMNTNSELNSQKMQDAIERVDRQERNLDTLKHKCQIEFNTWKNEFRNLEEKLDYRMTTSRRDLQDNIDACNNSISLVEKRTEQLPFRSNRSGRSDMKIITDHLFNLLVSFTAFIMLLISSALHLLIKFLNIGATISQNRNTLLLPIIIVIVVVVFASKWSLLFSKLQTLVSSPDIIHL